MDRLDVAIIRELFQGNPTSPIRPEIKLSHRAMARRLGVSEGTIRSRVKELTDSGFIRGFVVHPNSRLLGYHLGALMLDIPQRQTKEEAVEKLGLLEGVLNLMNYSGTFVGLSFYYDDEKSLTRKLALASRVSGATNLQFTEIPFPPCREEISKTDWKIISSLQKDPRKSYAQVASELGISSRTARRRLSRLIKEGAAFVLVSVDESLMKGTVRADLWVEWGEPEARSEVGEEILKGVEDYCFFSGFWSRFAVLSLFIPSIPAAKSILEKAKSVKGVRNARIEFLQERRELYDTLDELVEKKLARLGQPDLGHAGVQD